MTSKQRKLYQKVGLILKTVRELQTHEFVTRLQTFFSTISTPSTFHRHGKKFLTVGAELGLSHSATPLCRLPNLSISCIEIDNLLIQFKIMFHLIQRFHVQINKICLQKECVETDTK
jgi:hypothetical protein